MPKGNGSATRRIGRVFEIALSDDCGHAFVERLPGPIVRLNLATSQDVRVAIDRCRDELLDGLEWALDLLYRDGAAPARAFVRNANGREVIAMIDPCLTYGSQAVVRS